MGQQQAHWANHIKRGYRADLGHSCRSTWEANYARYLKYTGILYFYEPCEFWFPIEKGVRTYTPDFWLPEIDIWVEVKGYMDAKSKTKLKRFKKYYPEECLELVTKTFFAALNRQGIPRLIEHWE